MFDDGCCTDTSRAQHALELRVARLYGELLNLDPQDRPQALTLCRDSILRYLHGGLGQLPAGFASLDASKPWICYWITHSLALLGTELPPSISQDDVIAFLSSCQHPAGGWGGGVGQLAHLAPTYAAVCTLGTLGTPAAFDSIQQQQLHAFLQRMAIPAAKGGGFTMHEGACCRGQLQECSCMCMPSASSISRCIQHTRKPVRTSSMHTACCLPCCARAWGCGLLYYVLSAWRLVHALCLLPCANSWAATGAMCS
jgi:protein farnesyltransferase subunit beta